MTFDEISQLQSELVRTLRDMTLAQKAQWFRRRSSPSLVFCVCGHDLLVFELSDGTRENFNPFENTHGISVTVRNYSFLWLEGLDDWDALLQLVRSAQFDNEKYALFQGMILRWFINDIQSISA